MSKIGTRRSSGIANSSVSSTSSEFVKVNKTDEAQNSSGIVNGVNSLTARNEHIRRIANNNLRIRPHAKHGHAYLRSAESAELMQEFESEIDPEGEKKIDKNGYLLGDREYKVRCFNLPRDPKKLFVLSGDVSKALNFRDTYVLYLKNSSLVRIMASPEDREYMRENNVLSTVLKNRSVSITTARSMFRVFGHKCIKKGRPDIDDYWVSDPKNIIIIEPPVIIPHPQKLPLPPVYSNTLIKNLITSPSFASTSSHPDVLSYSPGSSKSASFIRADGSTGDYYSLDYSKSTYSIQSSPFSAKKPTTSSNYHPSVFDDPNTLSVLSINNSKLFRAIISSLSYNKSLIKSRRIFHIDSQTNSVQYPTKPVMNSPTNVRIASFRPPNPPPYRKTPFSDLSREELADKCINDQIKVARAFQDFVFNEPPPPKEAFPLAIMPNQCEYSQGHDQQM